MSGKYDERRRGGPASSGPAADQPAEPAESDAARSEPDQPAGTAEPAGTVGTAEPEDDLSRKVDQLKELCDLKARGLLTEAEFRARKSRLLES